MKYQPDHNITESFRLWFNDFLLRQSQAYSNVSGELVKSDGPQIQDQNGQLYNPWIYPDSQWAYDSSLSGTAVPNGVTLDGVFKTDVKISLEEGKVWIPEHYDPEVVTAYFSSKDFSVEVSTQKEEEILFGESPGERFGDNPTGLVPEEVGLPYVYLQYQAGKSQALGFGGLQTTRSQIRAVTVTNDPYLFDGITSLFRDSSETHFAVLTPNLFPFDEFGALKAPFNYRQTAKANAGNLFYIKEVTVSPFSPEINAKIAKDAIGGLIDFKLESLGYPHARFV